MGKNREDHYRRLAAESHDELTRERRKALVVDLEKQIAAAGCTSGPLRFDECSTSAQIDRYKDEISGALSR